ncbi:unnamed protein product [Prunus armeniaca]
MASVHLCHPCGMLDGYLKSSGLNPPWEYHLQPNCICWVFLGCHGFKGVQSAFNRAGGQERATGALKKLGEVNWWKGGRII